MSNIITMRSTHSGEYNNISNENEPFLSLGVNGYNSPFDENNKYTAACFKENSMIVSNSDNTNLRYADIFTVCFWVKFPKKAIIDTVYPNKFIFVMNNGEAVIDYVLTEEKILNDEWHYFVVTRDINNNIIFMIDGKVIKTVENNTEIFDLNDNSYIYLGCDNYNSTGYDVAIDDFIVIDTNIFQNDISVPTDYIDVSQFKYCLYIKVSTGEVFGYTEV